MLHNVRDETYHRLGCCQQKSFKNTCVDITSSEVRVINSNKGYDWACKNCRKYGNDFNLQEDINHLKEQNKAQNNYDMENIITEIRDRDRRKNNLIIFNIEEQNDTDASLRKNKDNEASYLKDRVYKDAPNSLEKLKEAITLSLTTSLMTKLKFSIMATVNKLSKFLKNNHKVNKALKKILLLSAFPPLQG
ncbi:hypothetical protein NQ318_008062 [Aromia moschata]|uniref:Uncharacterized protein n=1 Tax=Aromia moschata TaxID=1265417 RepID=A0AAV8YPU8_9CUCU|nr:hypothetical protein NQ318_008062 [Aromia moschata]